MRSRFNLDLANADELLVHVYGPYGCGKTHLQGDFLRWAKQHGPVRFLNILGEDGKSSIAGMGLGENGETVETVEDFDAALADCVKDKLYALAVDSLPVYYERLLVKFLGSVRYPDPKVDGERAKMLWGQIGMAAKDAITRSRAGAKYVLWVSTFDRSDDSVTGGKGITPNLPGKLAWEQASKFDMVGYMTAQTLGANRVDRKVTFESSSAFVSRQRLPKPLTQAIQIPENGGGWQRIFEAVQQTFTKPNGGPSK